MHLPLLIQLVGAVLVAVGLVSFSGCWPTSESTGTSYHLPEVEPTAADRANPNAARQFRLDGPQPSDESAADWPQLFGPSRTCVAADQPVNLAWGAESPPLLWSIDVGTGYGSPVVSAGKVVFNHRIDEEEIVQCVRADDGTTIWQHRYPTTFKCEVEYSDGPYSTPVISTDRVYAVGGQGQLYCLDLQSGDVIWQRQLHQEFGVEDDLFPVGATPSIVDGQLIFNLGAIDRDAGIIALDASTGEDLWQSTDHPAGYCSPLVATIGGQSFVFVITNVGLVSLDPANGKMDWMVEHYGRAPMSYNAVSPLLSGDKILLVTGPGPGAVCVQVQPDRGFKELWRDRRVLDSQYNTLMLQGDHAIGFTAAGQGGAELRCVDIASGKLQWRYHSVLRRGQGLAVGGALVLLGERGHLAALLPGDGEPQVLAFTEEALMTEPCYCAPALAQSKLYLKDEQRLACFDLSISD